ncbi:MAG TPA: DegT/DnrJ/EryC1/StrS family aminotransferase [Candidatus Polarisedimenticolia bacterium]|nr:DegT/DnrJ/EryC1/StrS family aminotransferase [Candidatus Polarisedimenticolia bacterium]
MTAETERVAALDPAAEYAAVREEIDAAVSRVLASGRYVGGPEVEGLEAEFAAFCGVTHAVAVSTGTDALRFALIASGLPAGGEVVTSPFTFIGTTEAIHQAGGRAIFADILPDTFAIDPARVKAALTLRTAAVLPVHLYGHPADMDSLQPEAGHRRLTIVEDACQAHGASLHGRMVGGMGTAGCFSFYPTKNLGACGEGGMVTTGDAAIAARVRRLRDHGQSEKYLHAEEGYNGRLDAVQAAILRVKLRRLWEWNERRRSLATLYADRLAPLEGRGWLRRPVERPGVKHAWHLYAVRIPSEAADLRAADRTSRRDQVRARLLGQGIETGIHYPVPLHRQPAYASLGLAEGSFPEAERAAREVLTLPIHPHLSERQAERVATALAAALESA